MSSEKPQVEYRRVGKSGLRVSVPILGAMSFGSDKWEPWVINEAEVRNEACAGVLPAHRVRRRFRS
jgi:hypothetical protein